MAELPQFCVLVMHMVAIAKGDHVLHELALRSTPTLHLSFFGSVDKLGDIPGSMSGRAEPLFLAYKHSVVFQSFVTFQMSQLPPTFF